MSMVKLRSGVDAWLDIQSFTRFGRNEWPYFDGIPDRDPMRILPDDVQATVSMNSFVNTAEKVQEVHRGLQRTCERFLPDIPPDADLLSFDPDLVIARELLDAACRLRGVLLATATKVLSRKRPDYLPMLDNVVVNAYCDALGRSALKARAQEGEHAASVGVLVLDAFRTDLGGAPRELSDALDATAAVGAPMTPVRASRCRFGWQTNPSATTGRSRLVTFRLTRRRASAAPQLVPASLFPFLPRVGGGLLKDPPRRSS